MLSQRLAFHQSFEGCLLAVLGGDNDDMLHPLHKGETQQVVDQPKN